MHCNLATGGPGAATPHAPFGRPRRPLGTFPRGESTSSARRRTKPPTRDRFLVVARERAFLSFFCFSGDFASAEATKGLSGRPLETFGVHPVEADGDHKKFLVRGKGKRLLSFFCFLGAFASAEATRGLSARPLDPFGDPPSPAPPMPKEICKHSKNILDIVKNHVILDLVKNKGKEKRDA